jgi:arginyl-tRNA synthetase
VITRDVRHAIARAVAAEGLAPADPGLRPGGSAGCYSSSVAFGVADRRTAREVCRALADRIAAEPWIERTQVRGPGFLALTVTPRALTALPGRIAAAGPACARSDALRDVTLEAPPPADLPAATSWEEARKALAAELTARLAAAAGATVTAPHHPERTSPPPHRDLPVRGGAGPHREPLTSADRSRTDLSLGESAVHSGERPWPGEDLYREGAAAVLSGERPGSRVGPSGEVAAAVDFAGADSVRFWLARAVPGRPVRVEAAIMARHVPDNPAYAVRYAHARAASGVRWAAIHGAEAVPWRPPADPGELALLDALSWLPERVAVAARRRRPDEFARYLEELASVAIATLISARHPGSARAPGSDRLALAGAARTGLAAGLGLLGVSAPDRL